MFVAAQSVVVANLAYTIALWLVSRRTNQGGVVGVDE